MSLDGAKFYRNLNYRWRLFGKLEVTDFFVSFFLSYGLIILSGGAFGWLIPVFLSIAIGMYLMRIKFGPRKFMAMTQYVFGPKHYIATLGKDELSRFPVSNKELTRP